MSRHCHTLTRLGFDCHDREEWYTYQGDVMTIDRVIETELLFYEDRLLN